MGITLNIKKLHKLINYNDKVKLIKSNLDLNKVIDYYINQNRTLKESAHHFKLNLKPFQRYLKKNNIKNQDI
jgi:hypothetical protein